MTLIRAILVLATMLWWSASAQTVTVATAIQATAGTIVCTFASEPSSPTDTVNLLCRVGTTEVINQPVKLLADSHAFTWAYNASGNNVTGQFSRTATGITYQVSAKVGTATPVSRSGSI